MLFSILTLFPEMFSGPLDFSILKRAKAKSLVDFRFINIRDFAKDHYKTVDDRLYGGGVGMILKVDVLDRAIEFAKFQSPQLAKIMIILLDPRGKTYNQTKTRQFASYDHLILICGHYEGVDYRVTKLVDEVISIGDYIVTGGEIPALIIIDSVTRLTAGVLRKDEAIVKESFTTNELEAPQYTRPKVYKGMAVPRVLLSGNHREITKWKQKNQLPGGSKD